MSEEKGYNGWKNYETWCIGLWLDNDQCTYNESRELSERVYREKGEVYDVADELKEYVESFPEVEEIYNKASFVTDLFSSAFSEIDWYELADHYVADITREKYRVWSLDVWGNDEEGYTVNDRSEIGTIELFEDPTDEEIFNEVSQYLQDDITELDLDIDGDGDIITIDLSSNGKPLLTLERV